MNPYFQFILAALSTYRLSLLVSKEDGPAFIFRKLRKVPAKNTATSMWLSCIFCFSMTASAAVCGILYWTGLRQHLGHWFLYWCSLSSVAIAMNQKLTKGDL